MYKCREYQAKTTSPLGQNLTEDISHGRHITRKISVFQAPDAVQSMWANSQRFILVNRSGTRGFKPYQETAYYLSSRQENAEVFGEKIRGHWRSENQLHWVKDVILKEDKSPLHQFGPVTNFSILKGYCYESWTNFGLPISNGRSKMAL